MTVDTERLETLGTLLLEAIGEDPNREGIAETPRRFAKAWAEFIDYDPGNHDTTFESSRTDELVAVGGIEVWSMCEHHLLPFTATIHMGYIARGRILGLSKFARIAHKHAHRLQLQEQLVTNIADELSDLLDTDDIAVLAEGIHTCMVMRGIRSPGMMATSVMRGRFRDTQARPEFLEVIQPWRAPRA